MDNRRLLIASTSTLHGSTYLEYLKEEVKRFFSGNSEIVFIPYARPGGITFKEYTHVATKFFNAIGLKLRGLNEFKDPVEAIKDAEGIFTGGGNTFVLLNTIYQYELIEPLRIRLSEGIPYMGTSAGSNILGPTIQTTNDMPIVYPPSFDAIGAVPFNINPHFLDPDTDSTHMGESRETRIKEFLAANSGKTVVGLREGSYLVVYDDKMKLKGERCARIFLPDRKPLEVMNSEDLSFLLNN